MFRGSMVALVTPFKKGKVDEEALVKLVEFHVKEGTKALVPCGTTGESPTLSHEEHKRVIEIVIEASARRVPVIAGTGSNSTDEAIELTHYAESVGADAALLIAPYYNRPTQNGLYEHFAAIAKNVNIPIILYNIPGRTGVNVLPETMARLSKIKNIVAVKEASGSLDQMSQIASLCDMALISGDDSLTLPILSIGGVGVISVAANILPRKVQDMIEAWDRGQIHLAQQIHFEIFSLTKALFIETNPTPIKTAMAMMGLITEELRLPLVKMGEENRKVLEKELKKLKLV
ncbi:MAG: 4-hydroxy-tetrahydrodipicolinate synthase [Chlamydiae bacterium]|nr:4-hydroxy-tetrahydrodipicolinate synthase [Chlamydiota bacterium]MBI3265795.1 4-hydroxy-tetrahydrodipicolinate synthase [Chlamydiota bacterium]